MAEAALEFIALEFCPTLEPILVLSFYSRHHIVSATEQTRNPRRPACAGRALCRVLYAQQRENVAHAFFDWRRRAAHARPGFVGDANEKDAFANTARLVCIAHAATVSVLALEAWMKSATPDEKMDMTEPPSEAFDRQEVIVLMGESHSGQKQKFLPIIRSGNGKFFNLGETAVPGMDKMEGRFAQILPPKVADDQMRLLAQTMLKVKGVKTAKPIGTVLLPRSRR
jgi:hypothetical protein